MRSALHWLEVIREAVGLARDVVALVKEWRGEEAEEETEETEEEDEVETFASYVKRQKRM